MRRSWAVARGGRRHNPLAGQVRALGGQAEQVVGVRVRPEVLDVARGVGTVEVISAASCRGAGHAGGSGDGG